MCRRAEACNRRSTPSSREGRFDWPRARPTRAPSRCRPKAEAEYILITTATALPPPGVRIDPSYKPSLATIRSSTTSSALSTAAGASYYRIVGVAFEANQNGSGDIIALGRADQTTLASIPHHIELDRVLIAGNPSVGQKRAIAANAISVSILNSDIRDIKAVGQDSQAIAAWNSPGPFVIRNNYLEAAGENILFGGADIMVAGVIPSDITVEDNVLTKNPAWRGSSWTVKNIFELKNARRVVVRRNLMLYNWGGSQTGFAVVFTPRNSSGRTPWVEVSDVEFSGNTLAHSGSAFNLLGHDDTDPSGQLARVVLRNNLVYDIDGDAWAGNGTFAQIGGEPSGITIDHNTILHTGNVVTFYSGQYTNSAGVKVTGGPIAGFSFTNNLVRHNAYGIFGIGPELWQRHARVLRARRRRARKRDGNQQLGGLTLSARQLVPVSRRIQRDISERRGPGLPPCRRKPLCRRRNRWQEHRLRFHDAAERRCQRRLRQTDCGSPPGKLPRARPTSRCPDSWPRSSRDRPARAPDR